jgi:hypothetical protein
MATIARGAKNYSCFSPFGVELCESDKGVGEKTPRAKVDRYSSVEMHSASASSCNAFPSSSAIMVYFVHDSV